jgi:hypothetical protein
MISGRQTLGSIEASLREQHARIKLANQQLAKLGDERLELQKTEVENYRTLARQRIDYIASNSTVAAFDESEHKVIALLQQRKAQSVQLTRDIEQLERQREELNQHRSHQADVLESAATVVDEAEAKTQQRLDADPAYQAQRDKARDAARIALHADQKATTSEQEHQEKGQSYRNDPLFTYLWDRKFGTSEYRANPLSRWLDGRVAKKIGYLDARTNYARLEELPLRLREHSDRRKQRADDEYLALKKLDEEGRIQDGIPALEAVEKQEQQTLDAIDAQIADNENQFQEQIDRKKRFAAGNDKGYKSVVEYLTSEMSRTDLQQLRYQALATPYPEDDIMVNQLLDTEQEKVSLEKTSQGIQQSLEQYQQRLKELEAVRAEFKRRRYDNPRSGFSNGALVGTVLQNVLNGAMRNDSLWDVLAQQQRHHTGRANPSFGSGGFGRGTIWGGGHRGGFGGGLFGGRGGGGFGGLGGGGGGGGGGFRTGGGF